MEIMFYQHRMYSDLQTQKFIQKDEKGEGDANTQGIIQKESENFGMTMFHFLICAQMI